MHNKTVRLPAILFTKNIFVTRFDFEGLFLGRELRDAIILGAKSNRFYILIDAISVAIIITL